jgi:hypothetical protein
MAPVAELRMPDSLRQFELGERIGQEVHNFPAAPWVRIE